MKIEPAKFWRSNYYKNPPLTDEMVQEAQRQLGVQLPDEYLALVRYQNGGYTAGFGHPMKERTSWAVDHVPLHALGGIVTDPNHKGIHNILQTTYMTAEWGLPSDQVLLDGDGHYWITLDYRRGDIPTVAWIDVEVGQDMQVAANFAAFLNGLRPESDYV